MRSRLARPWALALLVTTGYAVISVVLLLGDGGGGSGPDALAIAMTPVSGVLVFLAAWLVLRLMRRNPVFGRGVGAAQRR